MVMVIILHCGAVRGSTVLGTAARLTASAILGASTSAAMLGFESDAALGGLSPFALFTLFTLFTLFLIFPLFPFLSPYGDSI